MKYEWSVISEEDKRRIEEFLGVRIVEAMHVGGDCYIVLEKPSGEKLVIGFNELGMWITSSEEWSRIQQRQ